jgi:hypothetical protein
MALPITIPYTFATATTSIPLSNLDSDFTTVVNAINGIGNGTNSISNATVTSTGSSSSRSLATRFAQTTNVKDFGAKGDGSTDDYAAIQAAINYAQTLTQGTIYFPAGSYKVSSGLVFTSPIGIDCDSSATITATSSITVMTLAPNNYTLSILRIPSLYNGKIGLLLYGTSLAQIFIGNIAGCETGLSYKVDNTNKVCADNVLTFTAINSCTENAILFNYAATTLSGVLFQGNQIKGNFIVSCKYSIHFYDVNNGSLGSLPWDDTEIDVFAIDPANLTGSIGIYGEPNLPPARTFFTHKGFFDAFDVAYIKGGGNGNTFKLSFSAAPAYSKMQVDGVGNRIIECSGGQQGYPGGSGPFALTTAVNTRATFNGGNPLQSNRFYASATTTSAKTAGQTQTFYFYHPLMQSYFPKVTVEPLWDVGAVPLVVGFATEYQTPGAPCPAGSSPYPFQGAVQVVALGNVANSTTINMYITLHDAVQ